MLCDNNRQGMIVNQECFCFYLVILDIGPLNELLCVVVLLNTHTRPFNGPFSGTTRVSQYCKGKTNLGFS